VQEGVFLGKLNKFLAFPVVMGSSTRYCSKSISYGLWYPAIDRVHVTTARGIHFSTMGHSVARTAPSEGGSEAVDARSNSIPGSKLSKRLELLPEEALYLVERGALFCYKFISNGPPFVDSPNPETSSPGAPMSVQQAFAEMTGREGMTLERYQVIGLVVVLSFYPDGPAHRVLSTVF
jgi:tRNA-splicing endonuclease subunit Sen54